MTTVSSTFTAVGASSSLAIAPNASVTIALTNTWVGRVVLQKALGAQAWQTIRSYTGNVSTTVTAGPDGDIYRWYCDAYTSGTVTYSLADSSTNTVSGLGSVARATETTFVIDTADINGGAIDGAIIGAASPAAATVTTLTASGLLRFTGVETAITAHAGGTQAAAQALSATKNMHHITVCATNADSVIMPAATTGQVHWIKNMGAATLQIFGALTETIDDIASATGIAVATGKGCVLFCPVAGKWYAIQSA
jgi:hypothetical protein